MTTRPAPIRIKPIALPTEHGGWGLLLEPIVLALLVAPTLAGVCCAVAATAAFLARHPLKLAARHRHEILRSRRYRWVAGFATTYLAASVAGSIVAVTLAGWKALVPFALLGPFVLVFIYQDARNLARSLPAELAGPPGLAATAPSIALAAGWDWEPAFALWVLLMARALPSIIYVRAKLRLERGRPTSQVIVFWWHVVFAVVVLLLVSGGMSPTSSLLAFALLWGRSLLGLSRFRRLSQARHVGYAEIAFGALYVLIVACGYRLW